MKPLTKILLIAGLLLVTAIVLLSVAISITIKSTYSRPQHNYVVDVFENGSMLINYTFDYDPFFNQPYVFNKFAAVSNLTILKIYDQLGPLKSVEGNYAFTSNYPRSRGFRPVTTILFSPGEQLPLCDHCVRQLGPLIYRIALPLSGENITAEIRLPEGFSYFSSNGKVISLTEDKKTVRFNQLEGLNLVVNVLRNQYPRDRWERKDFPRYVVISDRDRSSWETLDQQVALVEKVFPKISEILGLPNPYDRFILFSYSIGEPGFQFSTHDNGIIFDPGQQPSSARIIVHETVHAFLEQINHVDADWFDEGMPEYVAFASVEESNPESNYLMDYESLRNLYSRGETYDYSYAGVATDKRRIDYDYGAFILFAYVQKFGPEALHQFVQKIKAGPEDDKNYFTGEEALDLMIEASRGKATREDILYPYQKLFFEDEAAFKEKVAPTVRFSP